MGLFLVLMVGVYLVKTAAVDTAAMATGRTPPSHAYRMAKLEADAELQRQALKDPAKAAAARTSAPDLRGGAKMVARHWYLDACEDVDEWRAARRLSRPERKARKAQRRARRQAVIDRVSATAGARWGAQLGPVGRLLTAWSQRRARRTGARQDQQDRLQDEADEADRARADDADAARLRGADDPQEGGAEAEQQPKAPDSPPPVPTQVPDLAAGLERAIDTAVGTEAEERLGAAVADLNAKRAEKAATSTDTGTEQSEPKGTSAMAETTTTPDTTSDAGGLNPHISALTGAANYLQQLNTMLERVQAQMAQADMGAEVTGTLGTARDANTAAAAAMQNAAAVTEQVNRQVQEAYNASQGQAANKDYQQQGQ